MTIRRMTPRVLAGELSKMAYGESALVVITASSWEHIVSAYHSPLVERILNRAIEIRPVREVETKTLTFDVFTRDKQ